MLAENRTLACTQPSPTYVTHGAQKTKENRKPSLGTGYKLWSKISSEVPVIFKKNKGGDQMTPENKRKSKPKFKTWLQIVLQSKPHPLHHM